MPDSKWNFRLAEPSDAKAFSEWVLANPQIDPKDVQDGLKKNNPTALTFAVEYNGKVIAFVPVYCAAIIAHLGFNPEASAKDRLKALAVLKDGLAAFFVQFGIRELHTFSKPAYGIADWAARHGFEMDERHPYRLNLNREMDHNGARNN
jgi:hypothetical protein